MAGGPECDRHGTVNSHCRKWKRNEKGNVVIESFTIAVDATLTDNNVQQTGESLADALLEGLRRTGVSVNMKR